ncbi:putative inorganic phosphate transporter 1-9 [Cucumis melo var. makuwa]|uniref:Inorganic phosphate transporter 1-9 n=2 Tax=Cucumis melo TaxID=3656 RepID=A0A5A7VFK3_CUCMM|nr:putative inorganic phosphate transporter 1-9 [Cucumis melo var. makuwa]
MGLKVLSALDTAKTQLYHFKAIVIAGMGLFTDAYDLFSISPIMIILGRVYYQDKNYEIPATVKSAMLAVALLGTAMGQLVFGILGDRVGRRRVYGLALALMVMSSIGCGFSICTTRSCVLVSLGFFRFLLGLGIGGDYPLSATIMSEFANKKTRGAFIAAVFSMQGFGILASATVTMVVCSIFDRASNFPTGKRTPMGADIAWRLILMLGAVPAAMTYYWRMMMPETARYTALVERNVAQAAKDMEKVLDVSLVDIMEDSPMSPSPPPNFPFFSNQFLRRHGRDLFACAASWFLVDIVFYSSNLFQSKIYTQFLPHNQDSTNNVYHQAFNEARLQAIVAVCSTIPGYWISVFFIDRLGRVTIQILGFLFMAIGYVIIAIPYDSFWASDKHKYGFMLFYCLTFFFSNFGPNTTTFILPAELFPARFRSTCHGISGASGKIGAIIGAVGFLWASHDQKDNGIGMKASLMLLGGVSLAGVAVTYFFTRETNGRSLEENENEDEYAGIFFLRGFNFHHTTAAAAVASSRLSSSGAQGDDVSSRSTSNSIPSTTPFHPSLA